MNKIKFDQVSQDGNYCKMDDSAYGEYSYRASKLRSGPCISVVCMKHEIIQYQLRENRYPEICFPTNQEVQLISVTLWSMYQSVRESWLCYCEVIAVRQRSETSLSFNKYISKLRVSDLSRTTGFEAAFSKFLLRVIQIYRKLANSLYIEMPFLAVGNSN